MKKEHAVLLIVNLLLIIGFGSVFIMRMNYEFIIYAGVIIFFLCIIGLTLKKVEYTPAALISLTVWSALHLAGGGIPVGEGRLYDMMIIRLSEIYPVFRYDQFVHIWGFGAATLVMYCLLKNSLHKPFAHPIAFSIVMIMAGLGVGAFNEILEFAVSAIIPESGVGGYLNTSLDLCADFIGAVLGFVYIQLRYAGNSTRDQRDIKGLGAGKNKLI
jgi:putative membrane protein